VIARWVCLFPELAEKQNDSENIDHHPFQRACKYDVEEDGGGW
jgi:hypothetical protein